MERTLRDLLSRACASLLDGDRHATEPTDITIEIPKEEAFGDLSTPAAMGLAKTLKRPPRRIAEEIAASIDREGVIEKVEGMLARYYRVHPEPALRTFFAPGLKVPAAIPGDQPLRLTLTSESPITGLPSELRE